MSLICQVSSETGAVIDLDRASEPVGWIVTADGWKWFFWDAKQANEQCDMFGGAIFPVFLSRPA